MGADQIGYLWTQPTTYDEQHLRSLVIGRLQEVHAELEQARKALNDAGDVDLESDPGFSQRFPRLEYLRHWDLLGSVADVLEVWSERLQAEGMVDQIVCLLTNHSGRDTISRPDPNNPSRCLCFAGEMTWGDEPDGLGYRCMRLIHALDLTGPLDIR